MDLRNLKALWEAIIPWWLEWIQVEVSAVCNAACVYCPKHCYRDGWDGGLMPMRTFECLASDFRQADLVFLQGWGEPLLHPQLWEMVRMVKSAGTKVGFTTNGNELPSHLTQLLESRVDVVGISLAGTVPATHEAFRSGCCFASIDEALRKIVQLKRSHRIESPGIHLAVMLMASNWREMSKLPELAKTWGVDHVVVTHLNHITSEAMEKESILMRPEIWPEVTSAMNRIRKECFARGIGFNYYEPRRAGTGRVCTENVLSSFFVSRYGEVFPCVMAGIPVKPGKTMYHRFQGKPVPLEKISFGNIHDKSLREIWKSDSAREFRHLFKIRRKMKNPSADSLPTLCRGCYRLTEPQTKTRNAPCSVNSLSLEPLNPESRVIQQYNKDISSLSNKDDHR